MLSKKEIKRKQYLQRRSKYQEKRLKKNYKLYKKRNKLIRKLGLRGGGYIQKEYVGLKMPKKLSFIEYPNEILKAIETGRNYAKKRIPLEIVLNHVKYITTEAVALLIATLSDKDFDKINVRGDAPADDKIREVFIKSGFYNYVKSTIGNTPNINILLHQRSNKKVNTGIAKEVCLKGLKHTLKSDEIFEPLYDILIECMSNTHNHADPTKDGVYDWWLYTYFDEDTNVTFYSFFDFGVGIFESISVKDYKQVMRDLGITHNVQLIEDLYNGKIKSRTHLPERGKGLPQIYSYANNEHIKNLTLITNNVYSNMSSQEHYELEVNFSGTFYYWELHP